MPDAQICPSQNLPRFFAPTQRFILKREHLSCDLGLELCFLPKVRVELSLGLVTLLELVTVSFPRQPGDRPAPAHSHALASLTGCTEVCLLLAVPQHDD